MSERDRDLERLAEDLADLKSLDWSGERVNGHAATRAGLHALSELADGFRRVQRVASTAQPARPAPLFRFGPLEVVAKIAEGSQGEIYRAYDPLLDHHVALKLRKPDASGLGASFLEEAQRMARLRHPHVLSVYGAAIEDGRLGHWTELIQGDSLHDLLASEGPFTPEELRGIGLDLCGALGALHARGIVHGDVKPANVMRDHAGRIVLTDLGASHDFTRDPRASAASGTLPYLAPEILRGGPPSPAGDIYALGVLLYRIASRKYPYDTRDLAELLDAQERGARVPLAKVRAGLEPGLVRAIESALATDPAKRPANATQFARALAPAPAPAPSRAATFALAAGVALALVGTLFSFRGPQKVSDAAALAAVDAQVLRARGTQWAPLAQDATLAVGDRLSLALQGGATRYASGFDADQSDEVSVLYPLPDLDLKNPLPQGRDVTLPGTIARRPFAWQVSSASGSEELVLIVATAELAAVERKLAAWLPAKVPAEAQPRGLGVLAPSTPSVAIDSKELGALLQALDGDEGLRGSYRVWRFRYRHQAEAP